MHDSQTFTKVLRDNDEDVSDGSAYNVDEIAGILAAKSIDNRIHKRAYRNKPLAWHALKRGF